MRAVEDAVAIRPNRAIEIGIVVLTGAAIVVVYLADRSYRRWAKEASPFAGPRARAAAIKSSYRQKRSTATDIAQMIGDIVEAVELARSRAAGA